MEGVIIKVRMYYKLKMLESDVKLQKFKQGLIESLKCMKINSSQEGSIHSIALNDRSQDLKSQYRLFTVEGCEEEGTCNFSIVKQRNSFPCPNAKFRRSHNIGPIFNRPNLSKIRPKPTKKQKLFEIIQKIEKSKNISRLSTPQRLHHTETGIKSFFQYGINLFKKQRKQTPLIKIRGSLRINKKVLGKREENIPSQTSYQYPSRSPRLKKEVVLNKTKIKPNIPNSKTSHNDTEQLCRWGSEDQFIEANF